MPTPASTYRVQLNPTFDFDDAADIVGYLADLGVTHLYCSPYLQAAPGSTHGYDVVDPRRLNAELGGSGGHARLTGALRAAGLGQVLDIVPNHMATHPTNEWWWDVLEHGPSSPYAAYFDIDWGGPDEKAAHTVLVPVLADHYGRVLEAGGFELERAEGTVVLRYGDHVFPISPRTLDEVLATAARRCGSAALGELADRFAALPDARLPDRESARSRHEQSAALAAELRDLCATGTPAGTALETELHDVARSPDQLDRLLRRQNYRLTHWRTADDELDYRRFFNIETLIGLRVEDPEVFAATHSLVVQLVADGTVDGLRVDHVDGLRQPHAYLDQLRAATGGTYAVVEKILAAGETLPEDWAVAGTSGYDFLIRVNDLFVRSSNEGALTEIYADLTGEPTDFAEVVEVAKQDVMAHELAAEVDRATALLAQVVEGHRRHRDHTRRELREALRAVVAAFPAYRTYLEPGRPPSAQERRHVELAVAAAHARRPDIDAELVDLIGELARGEHAGPAEQELGLRLQQLTAPVMAKGVEDTAFYRYHRLVALNEVGGDPGTFGRSAAWFHEQTAAVARRWPATMLTLATHDTKRSADVRARLDVLSELPEQWGAAARRWAERNSGHRAGWCDPNAEHLLYQTLVGAWPLDVERAVAFMAKATKEAKVHTSWTDPCPDYDGGLEAFVRALLGDAAFCADVEGFLAETDLVARGRRSSLAQTALLLTCPGVPDLYQGSELWDLSLVDPDNRRPVDFAARRRLLEQTRDLDAPSVLACTDRGAAKQWMIRTLLQHRQGRPATYEAATYEPLELRGPRADDAIAFSRDDLAVVVPRLGVGGWATTTVALPAGRWVDVLTGREAAGGAAALDDLFAGFPVAVLARPA